MRPAGEAVGAAWRSWGYNYEAADTTPDELEPFIFERDA